MAKKKKGYNSKKTSNGKVRYNVLMTIVYTVGIILLLRLFQLQIIHGEEYREKSNTRLTRETTLKAARGNVLDSSGNKLISTRNSYNVEIYKTKIETEALNNSLLLLAQTLESNGDRYSDTFPITIEPFAFKAIDSNAWKKVNNIDENASAEDCFNFFKNRYKVATENIVDARKIIAMRYNIEVNGYSSTKSVRLATGISEQSYAKLNEMNMNFPGINTLSVPVTAYPYGELASHILGYVGTINSKELESHPEYNQNDDIGKTGIEKVFEKYLKGTDGIKQVDISVEGTITGEYIAEEATEGSDVVLTIDAQLQAVTEQALARNIENMQNGTLSGATMASEGSAVVLNVKTGEILAMASCPNYNPSLFVGGISTQNWNNYLNDSRKPLINKAISDKSAPGSTFKMVTAIAGLTSGAIDVNTKINDTWRYTYYDDYQPTCWRRGGHGWLDITKAIEHSCNYFFYETGRLAGIDKIDEVASSFGLGQRTGVELPDEIAGTLAGKSVDAQWTGGKTIQTAIGQLYNDFTPLQMAKYTAMIANGGKNIDVTIVKSINNPDRTQVSRNEIDEYVNGVLNTTGNSGSDIDIGEANIWAVKEGMKGVTSDDGGTAVAYFRDFNIQVGGKTGSASIGNDGHANAWFVGFAPFDDPEIAVAVYVKYGEHGGYTAPVAREIFAQYLGMNASQITEDTSAISNDQVVR